MTGNCASCGRDECSVYITWCFLLSGNLLEYLQTRVRYGQVTNKRQLSDQWKVNMSTTSQHWRSLPIYPLEGKLVVRYQRRYLR